MEQFSQYGKCFYFNEEMLRFNRYFFLLILISIVIVFTGSSPFFLIVPFLLFLSIAGIGSLNISSGMFVDAVCSNPSLSDGILLTFDDGPDSVNTIEVLDILDRNKVKALFFVIGEKGVANPQILEEMNSRGHSIGIHSYSHPSLFGFYPSKKIIQEIKSTHDIIFQVTGKTPVYFRPPFGVTNPPVAKAVKETGYITVGWSVRSFDTKIKKGNEILDKTLKKLKGGDIVLFHDTVKGTVDVLDSFISQARQIGFQFVTPDRFFLED